MPMPEEMDATIEVPEEQQPDETPEPDEPAA